MTSKMYLKWIIPGTYFRINQLNLTQNIENLQELAQISKNN